MKRVCFALLFLSFFFINTSFGQNLVPNASVEDYIECPEHLGGWPDDGNGLDRYIPPWKSLRGTPDYFNSCSQLDLLGWNNSLGYQEPRTGNGYIGEGLYHPNLPNAKEIFGVELNSPMEIGETYYCSFHVSMAFHETYADFACNRIGFMLMTENYLNSGEQDPTPNYVTYELSEIVTDTTNWIEISSEIIADSAYTMIAFGVFFDEDSINVTTPYSNQINSVAYYFFDDFCVTADPEGCSFVSDIDDMNNYPVIKIFPNPSSGIINIISELPMQEYTLFDLAGRKIRFGTVKHTSTTQLQFDVSAGMYILQIRTKKGVQSKRVLINTQ